MKTNVKRIATIIMSLVMAFTGVQIDCGIVYADETGVITISSAEELAQIGTSDNYPMNGNYKLSADIENVQNAIGNSSTPFTGSFDGDGHTVTLNINTEENYKGIFGYINGATVRNIIVEGTINSTVGWAAGITAKAVNSTITNCGSSVKIHTDGNNSTCFAGIAGYAESSTITGCYNTGDIDGKIKKAAGIVGQSKVKVVIENCYNTGNITTTATSSPRVGGIVGDGLLSSGNEGIINNCYTSGTITGTSQTGAFMGYIYTSYNVTNCYYLEGVHENVVGFNYQANIDNIKAVSSDELKTLVTVLGEEFASKEDLNNGYPVLKWQVQSEENTDEQDKAILETLVSELPTGVISPKYSVDKNIVTYLSDIINSKEEYADKNITVSIKRIENRFSDTNTYIEEDGTINYFYCNLFDTTPYRYYGQVDVTFELKRNNVSIDYAPRCINVYWDLDKVRTDVNTVSEEFDANSILGNNKALDEVTEDLSLPNYPIINHNENSKTVKWVSTKYTSSNPDVIRISDTAEWDSDYNNMYYTADVVRQKEDVDVTITAEFVFERYTMNSGEEEIETVVKEIPVKVLAANEIEEQTKILQENVNNYEKNLKDFNTGEILDTANVKNDIQLAIPRELGIDGKNYNISVESSDTSVMEVYGYRTFTYRPLPGQKAKKVTLTVTVTNKEIPDIKAVTQVELVVQPLTQEEIENAISFMNKAKTEFFNLIKNENADANNVSTDLNAFYGIYQDNEGNVYTSTYVEKPNNFGITKKIVNPTEPVPDYQRYWISSNSDVIDDETLRVTIPKYNTYVEIGAVISHEVYERYAQRYSDDAVYGELFSRLVNQKVTVKVLVKGTDGEEPVTEVPTTTKIQEQTTADKAAKSAIVKKLKVKKVKAKRKKKSLKITWKKNKNADGYQIVYATNKKYKSAKKITIKSRKKTSKKIKHIKKKKKYYIKVRAYKYVKGEKVYGKYTKIKVKKQGK